MKIVAYPGFEPSDPSDVPMPGLPGHHLEAGADHEYPIREPLQQAVLMGRPMTEQELKDLKKLIRKSSNESVKQYS